MHKNFVKKCTDRPAYSEFSHNCLNNQKNRRTGTGLPGRLSTCSYVNCCPNIRTCGQGQAPDGPVFVLLSAFRCRPRSPHAALNRHLSVQYSRSCLLSDADCDLLLEPHVSSHHAAQGSVLLSAKPDSDIPAGFLKDILLLYLRASPGAFLLQEPGGRQSTAPAGGFIDQSAR